MFINFQILLPGTRSLYLFCALHTPEHITRCGILQEVLFNPYNLFFREEAEKFNVWTALLNLENSYGTQDSLVLVFKRALEQNEPKKVFKQLVNIYVQSNKFEASINALSFALSPFIWSQTKLHVNNYDVCNFCVSSSLNSCIRR